MELACAACPCATSDEGSPESVRQRPPNVSWFVPSSLQSWTHQCRDVRRVLRRPTVLQLQLPAVWLQAPAILGHHLARQEPPDFAALTRTNGLLTGSVFTLKPKRLATLAKRAIISRYEAQLLHKTQSPGALICSFPLPCQRLGHARSEAAAMSWQKRKRRVVPKRTGGVQRASPCTPENMHALHYGST